MATGWEPDTGTDSRECGGLLDPNCWSGSSVLTGGTVSLVPGTTYPTLALGTGDVSIEFWIKMVLFTTWTTDVQTVIGFASVDLPNSIWEFRAGVYVTPAALSPAFFDGTTLITGTLVVLSPGWHHVVYQVERGAVDLMKVFVDGAEITSDSVATVTDDLGTLTWQPHLTDIATPVDLDITQDPGTPYPEALTDPFTDYGFYHQPSILGPVAAHLDLLTPAQMQDSILRRDLQNISNTKILYHWHDVRGVDDWERNPRHMYRTFSDFTPFPAAPLAEQGAVIVLDESGNDKDLVLQSFTEYGQTLYDSSSPPPVAGQRAGVVFAADPFFQTGGGVPGGA